MKHYRLGMPPHKHFEAARPRKRSIALNGLFVLACFYTLYFARAIFLPIVVAILLNFLLAPIVRSLKKFHIPEPISALLVILLFLGGIAYGFYQISGPANEWLARGPQNFTEISAKIEKLKKPIEKSVRGFFSIRTQIEKTTKISPEETTPTVTVKPTESSPFATIFTSTESFFAQLGVIFFILYFLLASGDFFLKKTIEIQPTLQKKKETVLIAKDIKKQISNFLYVKTITGIGLAVVISIVMYFLKMPTPIFWGLLAGLLEFIPYIGVVIGTILCGITSLLVFNDATEILLPPISFFSITSMTGNFIVPLILSRSLTLHPVIIFIGVIFGGWMWGVVGALISIPLLSILKIFSNNIRSLIPLSKFLGG
jgi:predicted PurR-regulated permease PerM